MCNDKKLNAVRLRKLPYITIEKESVQMNKGYSL